MPLGSSCMLVVDLYPFFFHMFFPFFYPSLFPIFTTEYHSKAGWVILLSSVDIQTTVSYLSIPIFEAYTT